LQYNVYPYTSALHGGFSSKNRQHNRAVIPRRLSKSEVGRITNQISHLRGS
jgi:hypothetical protein